MPQQRPRTFEEDLAALAGPPSGGVDDPFAADLARIAGGPPKGGGDLTRAITGEPPPDDRSFFSKAYDVAFTTPEWLQKRITAAADAIDTRRLADDSRISVPIGIGGLHVSPQLGTLKGFLAGALTGAGTMATPGDAAMTAAGLSSVRNAGRAISGTARAVDLLGSGATVARGAERLLDAESASDAALGVAQTALGAAGVRGARMPVRGAEPPPPSLIRGQLRAAPIAVTPEGAAIYPGARDIPMQQTGVGVYAPEPSSGRRAPVVDFDANGNPIYGGDPDAYNVTASRRPRALLPEQTDTGHEFVPTPGGRVARRGELAPGRVLVDEAGIADDFAADLAALASGQPLPPAKGTRGQPPRDSSTVPAAVMQREFEGKNVTRQVFSSDPRATDAPMVDLSPDDAHELRVMLQEMEHVPFTPRTFNDPGVGRGGAPEVVGGGRGAPVYQHFLDAGGSGTRADFTEAISQALAGQHSASAQRAIALARKRKAGTLSRYFGEEAGDLPQSGAMTETDADEFSRMIDRLSSEDIDDLGGLGEAGRVNPMLLARIAGGGTGALAGVGTSDEDDSTGKKILRGVVGGVLGAAAPSLLTTPGVRGQIRGTRVLGTPDGPPAAPGGAPMGTLRGRLVASGPGGDFPAATRPAPAPKVPRTDPLEGTEVLLGKMPEELRDGIRETLARNSGFDAQRRGVVNAAAVDALSQTIAIDATQRLKPGTALPAEAIQRFADGIATSQSKVQELAAKVTNGTATDADVLSLEAARHESEQLMASLMGARSEAGRALAQFRAVARVLATGNPRLINDAANGLRGEAARFAQVFADLPTDPVQRYRWLQQQQASTVMDKARAVFYANILSGVKTHERNILGNVSNLVSNAVAHPFAVAADVTRSAITGTPRTVMLSEMPAQTTGALVGLQRGFRDAIFALRHGVSPRALTGSFESASTGKLDLPRRELRGGGANPFNWPGRALDAGDALFRAAAHDQELYALAAGQAKREGLRGAAFDDRVAALVSGTDPLAQELQTKAQQYAQRSVFQEDGGPFVRWMQWGQKTIPGLTFVVPFVRTPANIFRQGLEFSPAGFAMKASRAGGREGAQALGRATAGTIAGGYLAYLAATGRLSGAAPADRAERAQLMESGWRPNSVRIGDKWVSLAMFQPIAVQANAIANAYQEWQRAGGDAGTADKFTASIRGTLRSQLDQSFLSGLSDLVGAIDESGGTGEAISRYAGRLASSAIPFSGALRSAAQAADPYVRDPETIGEQIKTGIPGLSSQVPARLDRFGFDVQREGGPLRRMADPFNVSTEAPDQVRRQIGAFGVTVGMPTARISGVDLSREEARQLQQAKGSASYEALQRLFALPAYQQLDPAAKADVIDQVIGAARNQVQTATRQQMQIRGRRIAR